MIRLVLADDHRMILEGLEQLFRREPDFEVVGTANNGEDAVAAVKRHRPDVLVLDVNMPRGDGMWVVRQLQPLKLPEDGHAGHRHNKDHQTGDRVRVRGEKIGETLALDSSSGGMETVSQVYPNTFGAQKTLVLLVNFQDNTTQPYTTAYAQDVVFNTTSNFHYENSYGQTWLKTQNMHLNF